MSLLPFSLLSFTPQTPPKLLEQAANLLNVGFHEHLPNAWPDRASAMEEILEMLSPDRICRAAVEATGEVLGWIGGIPEYGGNVWELHPLVVRRTGRGVGSDGRWCLISRRQVHDRGGLTIMLGSDDEDEMTTLTKVNLYETPWDHIRNIRNLKGHPYEFYQKMGYIITGVIPDANGPGKPDILMAKRVGTSLSVREFRVL